MLRRLMFAAAALLTALSTDASAQGQSFPCSKATRPDELTICSDERLSELDQAANLAFEQVKRLPEARAVARDLLIARWQCGSSSSCILDRQVDHLLACQRFGSRVSVPPWVPSYRSQLASRSVPPLPALPKRIGECTSTQISGVADRFGNDVSKPAEGGFDTGTTVDFINGGHQVSYEKVSSIVRSKIGDKVLMCLVSLPKDCPPGDERGKTYTTTNLRTEESWTLPDAQHMCGGA